MIENNRETIRNSLQTIRNNTIDLMWFTINVIATFTGTENKEFHYRMQRLQGESSFSLTKQCFIICVLSLIFVA